MFPSPHDLLREKSAIDMRVAISFAGKSGRNLLLEVISSYYLGQPSAKSTLKHLTIPTIVEPAPNGSNVCVVDCLKLPSEMLVGLCISFSDVAARPILSYNIEARIWRIVVDWQGCYFNEGTVFIVRYTENNIRARCH